jgi:hypothetical protein
MASATFEDHPTDPNKVILRKKPHLDKGRDYEEGFIDGMQHQMQSSVDKAVNAMSQRTWVGLTEEELYEIYDESDDGSSPCGVCGACSKCKIEVAIARAIEDKLKEKNT